MSLQAALRDAALSADQLDERGLMPLPRARALLAQTEQVTRENLDLVWAALASLADGDELASTKLTWQHPPRGRFNTAFVERYGAGALPWLSSRREHGILVNHPWCVVPCLLALEDPRALELLLDVDGVASDGGSMTAWVFERDGAHPQHGSFAEDAARLVLDWTRLHPEAAYPVLARRARTNARAAGALRALAAAAPRDVARRLEDPALSAELALPTELTVDAVLAQLDAASRNSWPTFNTGVDGRLEYFGMRVLALAAREGDGWALVFERLQGCDPDSFQVSRFVYGPGTANGWSFETIVSLYDAFTFDEEDGARPLFHGCVVTGPAGSLRLDESLFAKHDLRPGFDTEFGGWPARTLALRAYLCEHPGAFWPPVEDALAAAKLEGAIVLVSDAYQHPSAGGAEPEGTPWRMMVSESPVLRSLVDAMLARDPSRFQPGESNLDWRLHALEPNDFRNPWTQHRVPTDGGFLPAAFAEVGATGPLPLEEARALLAGATVFERGEGRWVGDLWVWDRDRFWAALLSLSDAEEAASALARLQMKAHPRDGEKNVALLERFGDDALRVVGAHAEWLFATVLGVGSPAGFRFTWGTPFFDDWLRAHPEVGAVELGRLGDAAALAHLRTWGAPQARRLFRWLTAGLGEAEARAVFEAAGLSAALVPAHVLAVLEHWAAQADGWPVFRTGVGPSREYHALRLLAARKPDSEDWVLVLERLEGYNRYLSVQRYVYAEELPCGHRTELAVSRAELGLSDGEGVALTEDATRLLEPPDYWTKIDGAPSRVALARALLDATPERLWPPVDTLGFGPPLVVSTAFAHVEGSPSESPCYRSLAEAIATGDASRFAPGESNLAWGRYAREQGEEEEADE